MDWLFELLVKLWQVNQVVDESDDIEIIVPVSYGAFRESLTKGNLAVLQKCCELLEKVKSEPLIAYGVFMHVNENEECNFRWQYFAGYTIFKVACCAKPVSSTIHEAISVKKCLEEKQIFPKSIVVVTGAGHSRRAKLVWKKEFPGVDIKVVSVPWSEEIESEQPMLMLRNKWKWLLINISLYGIFLMPWGYWLFKKKCVALRQPSN